MIEKMTKYSFVLLNSGKDEFLENLRTLGLVDISRESKPVDEKSAGMLSEIESGRKFLDELRKGEDALLLELRSKAAAAALLADELAPWGDYDREALGGFDPHFFCVPKKSFDGNWENEYPMKIVGEENGLVRFVVLGSELPPAKELETPKLTASEAALQAKTALKEAQDYESALKARSGEIPSLEKKISKAESDLSLYLASLEAEEAAENSICVFVGFAPRTKDGELSEAFDRMDGVLWFSEKAKVEDQPPIEFRNNWFVRMFEPITDMYGRPAYDGFDPTPFISIFFLLFFAMCMGDAGYGLILIVAGILLRKVKSFGNLAPLVITLGIGTTVVGFLFHNFFSIDFAEYMPEGIQKILVPSKVAGYDGTMILALIIGIIHLCLAMIVKTVNATKNKGFLGSLATWGWTLLIVGGVVVALIALMGVIDARLTKIIVIILGSVSAVGIFLLNDLHRNPLLNIGSGLWETYNTVTGLLGDVLSYLRLYALGLAGGMLGFAFNDLAKMTLGDGGFGWIPFIIIVLAGHALNLAMAALGAFVHPLRLNFLEFFKNSGYEAAGKKYNPLKN